MSNNNVALKMKQFKKLTPAVQGTLDSLCGIYSVVNSLYWLYGPRIKRTPLFRALVDHLHQRHDVVDYLAYGMETPAIVSMLRFLQSSRYRRYPITVQRPFIHKPARTARSTLVRCQRWLSQHPGRVILISDQYHWTVLIHIDDEWLYFFDSSTYTRIRRRRCSLRERAGMHQLFLDAIFFITREESHNDDC